MHELLDLRQALFQTRKLDARSVYDRKLDIIQNNIYGVDIDPFAVNIARLRLWLSLAVEGAKPEPLPNLNYKVERGDSLVAPLSGTESQASFYVHSVDEYLNLKTSYLRSHDGSKLTLKKQIEEKKAEITGWARRGSSVSGFDWSVEFAEVFLGNGARHHSCKSSVCSRGRSV